MPRRVKDRNLETGEGRSKLKARGMPYYRSLDRKLHLGYRRLSGKAGTWWARHYKGKRQYDVESIGTADDLSKADGVEILTFWQAQDRARERMVKRSKPTGKAGPYTVGNALDDYLEWLQSEGRPETAVSDARSRANALIRPKLGEREVVSLTVDDFRQWRDGLARALPRIRTKEGKALRHREAPKDATEGERNDARRARRSSANRIWTTLRAALNLAYREEKVTSDSAWRKMRPFKGVDKARVRYLEVVDAQRLARRTDPEFQPMVQAALLTGGRYGQLAKLTVADFNKDAGTVRMSTRKGDGTEKVYHVHLTDEGVQFFAKATAGRNDARGLILKKNDGSAWHKSEQNRRMASASKDAAIKPTVNFHCLRHTYASHAVMNGVPLLVVAKNLGHSDTRMVEKHYGHLAPSYIADAIRQGAPRFGITQDSNVTALER